MKKESVLEDKIIIDYHKTVFGELILGSFQNKLCLADWRYRKMRSVVDSRIQKGLNADYLEGESSTITLAKQQLDEYFLKERCLFNIPLLMVGSVFQKQVWNTLIKIPYGETKSYLQLAEQMQNKGAVRAVASANGANAISIIVPCHRIIGSDGSLTGYAGGIKTKERLLELEGMNRTGYQLRLF